MIQNILTALNQSPYYYFFLVVDNSLDISYPKLKYFTTINSKYYNNEVNSGQLLSNSNVIKFIENTSKLHNKLPSIIPFKPSAKIDFICKKNNWLKVSNNSKLNRLIEDKLKFSIICNDLKIPIVPFIIDKFNKLSYQKARNNFGDKLVIQTHFGWAGKSTFDGNNYEYLINKIPVDTTVKLSPYIENSYTLLNNCCLTHKGLIQSPPALQFTGIKPLTNNPFSTVGRQWPSTAPENIIKQVTEITQKFSEYLQEKQYKGFFGLDFLVDREQVYLLECNSRLTASFAFYTKIELNANIEPLFLFHLAEFSLKNYPFDIATEQKRVDNFQIIGTQLTGRNEKGKINKKLEIENTIVDSPKNFTIDDEIIKKVR